MPRIYHDYWTSATKKLMAYQPEEPCDRVHDHGIKSNRGKVSRLSWMSSFQANTSGAPNSVAASTFRPLPFLGNRHLQTVLASLWKGKIPPFPSSERHAVLDDGDKLVLHGSLPLAWQPGRPVALLTHGLGGTHASGYMQRVACLLVSRGWRAVRLDLRGCGRGAALARRTYHGGCSDDVRAAAAAIHDWDPAAPISLVGFSLGGNIVLKLAGEAYDLPVQGLRAVAAIAPPIDMERCAELIGLRRNRIYERYFVESLREQVALQGSFFPDMPGARFPRRLTMRLFDDLYTAPRGGFLDALDYYRKASSFSLIERIDVPAWILTARDDPFVAIEPFETLKCPTSLHLEIADCGGHLGFLGADGAGGIRWAERRMVDWLLAV
jgi:uncharacterized protein